MEILGENDKNSLKFFCIQFYFRLKYQSIIKISFRKEWVCSEILTKRIMRKFLFFKGCSRISQWVFNILKTFVSVEIPNNRDRIIRMEKYAQAWKYKAYGDYWSKNGTTRGTNLSYRDSNQILIYMDCYIFKGSFDKESL